jgi:non-ribosomal peptide synthetase component F
MPYDPATGIYQSSLPPAVLPSPRLSIFDFLFGELDTSPGAFARTDRSNATWLIDATTGRTLNYQQTLARTLDVARALHSRGLGPDDVLAIFSPNEVSSPPRGFHGRVPLTVGCLG